MRIITLGAGGAIAFDGPDVVKVPATPVSVIDTTAAGDTFVGYWVASRMGGASIEEATTTACRAAAICASRAGAIPSIPHMDAVRMRSPA